MQNSETDRIPVTEPNPDELARGPGLLILGVALFVLGLAIITAATFRFDMVAGQVFVAHPAWAPYVAGIGYVSALAGLLVALVHFIREG